MSLNVDEVVRSRYSEGALERQESLCCPVDYDTRYLEVLPQEILDRDYGCGDPSAYVAAGDTVLDLGSGGGKICYIASQVVGASGRVIGVDMNDDMLGLARRHRDALADRIGYSNVEFRRGRIQDLRTDVDAVATYLAEHPVGCLDTLAGYEAFVTNQREAKPLVENNSVDVVVSNCVLNLVEDVDKSQLMDEIFRVLRRGGRAVISDIVSDEYVPEKLKADPELWSGCISGAFQESEFVEAFVRAGFYGIEVLKRDEEPWRVVDGVEFRSVTVRAWKGKEGECWDHNQAVIYRGPWSEVTDDDGHVLRRGVPTAVCEKTYDIYTRTPYSDHVIAVDPRVPVAAEDAKPFDCTRNLVRSPGETKGLEYSETTEGSDCCGPAECG